MICVSLKITERRTAVNKKFVQVLSLVLVVCLVLGLVATGIVAVVG